MAKLSDYIERNDFFPELEYFELRDLVDKEIRIYEVKTYENDKGPGIAIRAAVIEDGEAGEQIKLVTHSKAIRDMLSSEVIGEVLKTDSLEGTVRQRKSTKSHNLYYTLE